MASEWLPTTLGCLLALANGRTSPERDDGGRFAVFGSNGAIGRASESNAPAATIVIGRVGSYCGSVHYSSEPCWVTDNAIRAVAKPGTHPYFAFCLLRMLDLNRWRAGSGQPLINQSILSSIEVEVPPSEVQASVGNLLSQIDTRIDLLRQTNATLESIAQALFKSWFIDFDPVHAKAEGREPEGMDAATAALFPAEFEELEVGLFPKGWAAQPFGSLLAHAIGGDWGSETETADCSLPATIIRGTDIPDIAAGRYHAVPRRFVSLKKAVKRILQDGDLAIEVSGGSKTQPTGRSLYLSRDLLAKLGDTVVPTSFCRLFRAKDSQTALVLARHLAHIYGIGKMWNYQVQSTGLANFQTQHFLDTEMVAVAPSVVFEKFFELVRPLVDRIHAAPIAELEAMRDVLLPRLISGKLRIPEAQAQLDEVIA